MTLTFYVVFFYNIFVMPKAPVLEMYRTRPVACTASGPDNRTERQVLAITAVEDHGVLKLMVSDVDCNSRTGNKFSVASDEKDAEVTR